MKHKRYQHIQCVTCGKRDFWMRNRQIFCNFCHPKNGTPRVGARGTWPKVLKVTHTKQASGKIRPYVFLHLHNTPFENIGYVLAELKEGRKGIKIRVSPYVGEKVATPPAQETLPSVKPGIPLYRQEPAYGRV